MCYSYQLAKNPRYEGRGIDLPLEGVVGYTKFKVTMFVAACSLKNQQPVTSNQLSLTTYKVRGFKIE